MYPCSTKYQNREPNLIFQEVYNELYNQFGSQNWWPAETPLETIIGAILTQSINWKNVEKAINNLKKANLLIAEELYKVDFDKLAQLIRPSGYYNMKARKLKAFINFLFDNYSGDLTEMFNVSFKNLRSEVLNIYGIGPETADCILLYAGKYTVFVIDAYTKRIFSRLGVVEQNIEYHQLQRLIAKHLEQETQFFNEYHALLVALAKNNCQKSNPVCKTCPLNGNRRKL